MGWPSGLWRWFAKPLRVNTPRAGSNPVPTAMPAQNINKQEDVQTIMPEEVAKKVVQEKILFAWEAPARPFKKRNKEYFVTIFAMTAIVALVLFFAEGFMPVLMIVALVFLYYTLNTVEPGKIEYKITNLGVKVSEKMIDWEVIKGFWFSKKMDTQVLVLELKTVPGRVDLVINQEEKEKIKEAMGQHVPENEIPPSQVDKTVDWVTSKLPGN